MPLARPAILLIVSFMILFQIPHVLLVIKHLAKNRDILIGWAEDAYVLILFGCTIAVFGILATGLGRAV